MNCRNCGGPRAHSGSCEWCGTYQASPGKSAPRYDLSALYGMDFPSDKQVRELLRTQPALLSIAGLFGGQNK